MPTINFKEAKEWLEKMNKEDSVLVIHDADCDGFSAGVLFFDWCKKKGAKVSHHALLRNKSTLSSLPLENFDKIIITDISLNIIKKDVHLLENFNVLFVDHHDEGNLKMPKNILNFNTTNSGYIPCARTAYELTKIKPWLGLSGVLGDAGEIYPENQEFIQHILEKYPESLEEFKEKSCNLINAFIIYHEGNLDEAFEKLSKIEAFEQLETLNNEAKPVLDEIEKSAKEYSEYKEKLGKINYYYFEPKFNIKGTLATMFSVDHNTGATIFASPIGKDFIGLSLRDNTHKINVEKVLVSSIKDLEGSTGGGHPFAAGGKLRKQDLETFKENVREYFEDLKG